ncbi:hypothetical protein L1987_20421 [Smallanthus sonchifolius]|uniref:Uncharacterized protein n=1 Tax=Smallanthus sonchifolius TaxID=185202 RepID=A0ACB9IS84_9ASTR|nr:hypothetical protein L1987_20421 [Smallanthus sonchifolius]
MNAALSLSATIYDDVAAQEAKDKAEKAIEITHVDAKRKSEEVMYRFKPRNFKFPRREGNNSVRSSQEQKPGGGTKGRVFVIDEGRRNDNTKAVAGTFLVNYIYEKTLFDTGANRSFVSNAFSMYLGMKPTPI